MDNQNKLVKNTLIIISMSIIAKVLSYIWEASLAAYLGTSNEADAFYMTVALFNILYPILDIGIWKVFLPIYKKQIVTKTQNEANEFVNTSETLFLLISILLVVFMIVFAKPLTWIIAPGFDNELKLLTIKYIRIAAPTYLLMTTASIIGAILQCHNKFFGSQIRELASHVSRIITVFLLYNKIGIYAALTALIIGSVFRVLLQIPFIDWKWKYKPNFDFKRPDILTMLRGLPSVSVTVAISNINSTIDKMIASDSVTGAVSCLNYGNKLINVFSGMFTMAIGTATYPTMAQYVAQNDNKSMEKIIKQSINVSIFLVFPITVFCILFSNDIVKAAFERGAFDASATSLTAQIFLCYSISMIFSGMTGIISNVFYAYGDTKTTMKISILNILLNIIFDITATLFMGVPGLALATSISSIICFFIRMKCLKKYIIINFVEVIKETIKIAIISLIACSLALVFSIIFDKINVIIKLIIIISIIAFTYCILAKLFRVTTFKISYNRIKKRFRK